MDFRTYKMRCSRWGTIMTNATSKELTTGHITLCKKIYREERFGRYPQIKSRYIEKGILQEEDGITLLTRLKRQMFKKNDERISNTMLTGIPDIYVGEDIRHAEEGYDTKCVWSLDSLPLPGDALDTIYEFQDHGYMALTGAKKWTTAFCLVNAPGHMITKEKYYVSRAMGDPSSTDDEFVRRCIEIEKNMIFDIELFLKHNPHYDFSIDLKDWKFDIPMRERLVESVVMRNDATIDAGYTRINKVREWLTRYHFSRINSGELIEA